MLFLIVLFFKEIRDSFSEYIAEIRVKRLIFEYTRKPTREKNNVLCKIVPASEFFPHLTIEVLEIGHIGKAKMLLESLGLEQTNALVGYLLTQVIQMREANLADEVNYRAGAIVLTFTAVTFDLILNCFLELI